VEQQPKKPDHMTICKWKKHQYLPNFLTTENNVAWHCIPPAQRLPEQTRGWWEAIHLSIGHNKQDTNTNPYQRGNGSTELQQSGTSNCRIRARLSRTRMDLLDNIPRKKQPHTTNSCQIPSLQHREWTPISTPAALAIPRPNTTRQHPTPMQCLLDQFKTIVTGLDHKRRSNHPQYWCQWGYLKPRNHSLFCWV